MKNLLYCLTLSLIFLSSARSQTDQTLDWFTYIGGPSIYPSDSVFEKKEGVAFGAEDEVYIAGRESNEELLFGSGIHQDSVSGGVDAFLIRFSDDGQFEWSNYFGGPADDLFESMCTTNDGKIIVSGTTLSNEGIVFSDAHQIERAGGEDIFLAAFNPDGTLEWSTYFGGPGAESSAVVESSSDGTVILAGRTYSSDLATPGAFNEVFDSTIGVNSFLAKFSGEGSLLWCTYLKGNTDDSNDLEESIATDELGNVYLAIDTDTDMGLATGGAYQTSGIGKSIVLAKFSPDGNLIWSTYVSGEGLIPGDEDKGIIAADPEGNIYLSGRTSSLTGIATGEAHQPFNASVGGTSAMLMKFNADGERLWGTYYGGTWSPAADYIEWIEGGVLLNYHSVYYDDSFGGNPFQPELNDGGFDAFITKFSDQGEAIWATAFGGDDMDFSGGIAVNGNHFVVCGSTRSEEFYGDENSWQEEMIGGSDLYLAQFEDNMSSGTPECANPFPAVNDASLSATQQGSGFQLAWDPVPNQIGCQIAVRFTGGNNLGQQIVGGANAQSFFIPGQFLQLGTDYEWRVRCGCSQNPIVAGPWSAWQGFSTPDGALITSSPNPTEGYSQVSFSVQEPQQATLEVMDMNGRVIEMLFSGMTDPNSEYRFEFDGSVLPNGVYLYRLTSEGEVKIEKFMIAR
ncbi:MAG: T9SS type A sorting domain-containing protein [Bacteroidota bacterium]